jgi:hypothetical protein
LVFYRFPDSDPGKRFAADKDSLREFPLSTMASKMPPVAPGTPLIFSGLMKGLATGDWLGSRLENDWPFAGLGTGPGVGSG